MLALMVGSVLNQPNANLNHVGLVVLPMSKTRTVSSPKLQYVSGTASEPMHKPVRTWGALPWLLWRLRLRLLTFFIVTNLSQAHALRMCRQLDTI